MAASNRERPNLRRARERRGLSLAKAAAGIHQLALSDRVRREVQIGPSHLWRWEKGVTDPEAFHVYLLCRYYDKSPAEIDVEKCWPWEIDPRYARLAPDDTPHAAALSEVDPASEEPVDRRDFTMGILGSFLVTPSLALVATSMFPDGNKRLPENLHALTNVYARQIYTVAPRTLLLAVRDHLSVLSSIQTTVQTDSRRRQLTIVSGETQALAGKLSFSIGNWGDAHAYYAAAKGAAHEAQHPSLLAYVLGQTSHLYSHLWHTVPSWEAQRPLALLDQALAVLDAQSSRYHRVWLLSRRAEEHAAAGNGNAAEHDLEAAARALAVSTASDDHGFFSHWETAPNARLAAYRGNCAQLVGRHAEAIAVIESNLAAIGDRLVPIRASILADLASAYARSAEPEQACYVLKESLSIASTASLVPYVQRVRTVRARLAPWEDTAAVKALDDELREVT